MGKRKRRLHSPKYAKKYASVRATYNRLRGVIEEAEADGVITEEEADQIKQAKEEVLEAVKVVAAKNTGPIAFVEPEPSAPPVVETAVEAVQEAAKKQAEVAVTPQESHTPVLKKIAKKKPALKRATTKRVRKPKKTEG